MPTPPDHNTGLTALESSIVTASKSTNSKLDELSVSQLQSSLVGVTTRVSEMEKEVGQISAISFRLKKIEESTESISADYDKVMQKCDKQEADTKEVKKTSNLLEKELDAMRERLVVQEERSMRDNLLFFGIPETGPKEYSEGVIHDFIDKNLSITRETSFHFARVHRMKVTQTHVPLLLNLATTKTVNLCEEVPPI